jgi:hypothetical protein
MDRYRPHYKILAICMLWHVDPLLGNDHEISGYTTAVAK